MAGDSRRIPSGSPSERWCQTCCCCCSALLCPFLLPLDSVLYLLASRSTAARHFGFPYARPFFSCLALSRSYSSSISGCSSFCVSPCRIRAGRWWHSATCPPAAPAHCRRQLRQGFCCCCCSFVPQARFRHFGHILICALGDDYKGQTHDPNVRKLKWLLPRHSVTETLLDSSFDVKGPTLNQFSDVFFFYPVREQPRTIINKQEKQKLKISRKQHI